MKKLNKLKIEVNLDEKSLFEDLKEIFKLKDDLFVVYHGEDLSNMPIILYSTFDMRQIIGCKIDLRPYLVASATETHLSFIEFSKNFRALSKECNTERLLINYKRFL